MDGIRTVEVKDGWWGTQAWLLATVVLLVGLLAAAIPYWVEPKALVAGVVGAVFLGLLIYDLEWAYLFFILLICILPSRYNQQYLHLGYFYFNVYDPLLGSLLLAWLFRILTRSKTLQVSGDFIWLGLMLAVVLVAVFFSSQEYRTPYKMYAGLMEWLRFGLYFLMTYHLVRDSKHPKRYFYILAAGSFIVAAYGIYSYFLVKSGFAFAGGPVKAFSFEKRLIVGSLIGGGATTLAGFLILTIPAVFTHWLRVKEPLSKLLFLGVLATQGTMLVLTFSRGGWLSLILAIILAIGLRSRKPLKIVLGLAIFAVLVLAAWRFLPQPVHARLKTVTEPKNEVNIERLYFWNMAAHYIRISPVIGSGPNNKYNTSIAFSVAENYPIFHCHNLVLYFCVEFGLLGAFIFLFYPAMALIRSFLRLRSLRAPTLPAYWCGVWAGVIGFLFHNQVDYFLWQPRISFVFWLMVLLLAQINTLTTERTNDERFAAGRRQPRQAGPWSVFKNPRLQ